MIRFTQQELEEILKDLIGKPYRRGGCGPEGYDCYGLVREFMARVGVEIADIGRVDPQDSRKVYERQQTDFIPLPVPRPWSLVTFSGKDLNAHIGVVLPGDDGMFLHCPGRAAGKVLAEPLTRRPWRESVDGYWWPKGYIETVVLLTPMTTTKKAWQFVKSGRCLAEIVDKDITEGRDVQVQVFLGGELVPPEKWDQVVPTEQDQIVVRPVMGSGKQAAMTAGMLALAVLAPPLAGAWVGATSGFAYHLASAAVMMGGGLALNALVGASEGDRGPSQHYSFEPQTTATVGSMVPLVYGTYGVRGALICSYAGSTYTTKQHVFLKKTLIRHASDLYHVKIAYSDGPIQGIVEGTEKVNDRDVDYYSGDSGFAVEHFRGLDDQAASTVADAFEIPVSLECPTGSAITKTFTAVDCDSAALVLRFPNGMTNYAADGTHDPTEVKLKAEIRQVGGAWHTLMNGSIWGDCKDPLRYPLELSGSYEGGSPFPLVAGSEYEARITRISNTHSDRGDSFLFDCVQFRYSSGQRHPGLAYTAIKAMASREISGSIQYYAVIRGKLVRVYNPNTQTWSIEWSDNPAWVAYDILTRPVISGNGGARPYAVEYYRRLDPSYLDLDDFVAFAQWCDEPVPDGQGGTEKRYVFNGVFDQEDSAWEQAVRVCRVGCAAPFFRGHKVGIVIDKPGLPTQMFNVSNLRSGFQETWIDTSEAATVFDVQFANEQGEYAVESYPVPLAGAVRDIPATMDGFGHTKRTQVWRRAIRDLRVNRHMKRTVEIPACLDAIYTDLGQIVYVQHPALNRAVGGRILEVYSNGIKFDKPVVKLGTGLVGHWRLNDCDATTDVVDSSGNGYNMTAQVNTATKSVPGKIGNALAFNGSSDYLTRPPAPFQTGTGSVSVWIKPASVTGANYSILSACDEASNSRFFNLGQLDGYLLYQAADGGTTDNIRTGPVLSAGLWHHVVFTGDGSTIRCYVNGGEVPFVHTYSGSNAGRWIGGVSSLDNLSVGVLKRTTPDRWFNGQMDDVRIYNRPLAEPEIAALYNRGFGTEEQGAADHALLVRTHDGTAERLTLYEVASVGGANLDIITINGTWEYTPNENDLATFGVEEKVVDLYRVKAIERDGIGRVLIRGTQYTTDFYSEDEDAPKVQAQVYSRTKGGRSPTLLPTTAEAIKASQPERASTLDSLAWEGLAFSGNGVDRVTWTCGSTGGAGIKYQGVWVPIQDDAVGTTDRYVYFDPNVGDPRYLQHTNDRASLAGQERYVFCINEAGVPNFRPGELIGPDEVKLDGVEAGADVTSAHAGDIVFQGTTPPSHVAGRLWLNTNWCGADCVGHWRLNDNAANKIVKDESAWGHHGQAQRNTNELSTTGKVGNALTFNGTTDYVSVEDSAGLAVGMGDVSGAIWFKTATAATQRLLAKRDLSGVGWDFYMPSDGRLGLYLKDADGHVVSFLWSHGQTVFNGQWQYAAFSVDRDVGARLYLNGAQSGSYEVSTLTASLTAGAPLEIGRYATSYFNGALDNAMVFRRALTQTDILAIHDAGTGTEQICLGSTRALLRSDGTRWLLADSDSPTIPRTADDIAETEDRKWAAESGADVTSTHASSILFRQDTAPANPAEGWTWWDTSGLPVLIKRYNGSEWVTVGVDIQHWLSTIDPTKLDGTNIAPQTVTTDALAANSVTAAKMLVGSLSAITQYVGTLIGGSITGVEITGGVLRTATSGRRIQIDSNGLTLVISDTAGKYGTFKYGSGTKYGAGHLAKVGNTISGVPFEVYREQTVADFRYVNRASNPSGPAKVGDTAVVGGKLKICTVAGTPGTWTVAGTQT